PHPPPPPTHPPRRAFRPAPALPPARRAAFFPGQRGGGGGGLVAVEGAGLLLLDERLRNPEVLCDPEAGRTMNRYNDGAVDPRGRIWIGSMRLDGDEPTGFLHRVEPEGSWRTVLHNIAVSNGIAWSPDQRTMYFTDTGNRRIDAYDYNANDGTIADRRDFAHITDGWPDGHCTDAQGGLWVAFWGGSRVTRYDASGAPTHEVRLPCANVTSCCFIGEDLDVLAITTARSDDPGAGALYAVRAEGITGTPSFLAGC
ncbi:MAG: SMP-30/gluconolactonase/LRE family protein, partial [Planctomycetota bacterium]